jgi:DNA transformation protein
MAAWARKAYDCAVRQRKTGKAKPQKSAAGGLKNLGPKSRAMLAQAGITTEEQLRKLGAVSAYARTKVVCPKATLNLLWALEGALTGRHWQEVAATERASLLMALEDVYRWH